MNFLPVPIPTNQSFLQQWYAWTLAKVSARFKRDKDRVPDAAQNARLRLLAKDFVGRWFFKHLTDELVDKSQAERMLGLANIEFIGSLPMTSVGPNAACHDPACQGPNGCVRSCGHSLWRVSDILKFAKFDYHRYYYSVQNHTIGSDDVLRLLGYPLGSYGTLESLYRQGRLRPSELTDHDCVKLVENSKSREPVCSFVLPDGSRCSNKHLSRGYCSSHYGKHVLVSCPGCEKGLESLRNRGLSLAQDRSRPGGWNHPDLRERVSKLRWNDSQLKPMLRGWKKTNMLRYEGDAAMTPEYIVRPVGRDGKAHGIDAGLLKYANMIIDNEVVNDFKRIARSDDVSTTVFNKGLSPAIGDDETVAWESDDSSDDPSHRQRVFKDAGYMASFARAEARRDLMAIMSVAGLTDQETAVIRAVDLGGSSVKELADQSGDSVARINRVRASAMQKLRDSREE